MTEKVFVIIPCYNEESCIRETIAELRRQMPEVFIVAVNDGSADQTLNCLRSISDERLTVLDLPFNSGVGTAVQTGFLFAVRHNADYAVKFDADGQHPAEEISDLLAPLQGGEADLVIGSRFLKKTGGFRSSFSRRTGIRLFRFLSLILTGTGITDATSGFRAYGRDGLKFASLYYPVFDYPEPEECILFLRNGYRIKEIPCTMRERQGGCSSIGTLKAFYFMPKVAFAMIMERFRSPKGRK